MKIDEMIPIHTPHLEDKYKGTRMILDMLKNDRRIKPEARLRRSRRGTQWSASPWTAASLVRHDAVSDDGRATRGRTLRAADIVGDGRLLSASWSIRRAIGVSDLLAVPQFMLEMRRRGHPEET